MKHKVSRKGLFYVALPILAAIFFLIAFQNCENNNTSGSDPESINGQTDPLIGTSKKSPDLLELRARLAGESFYRDHFLPKSDVKLELYPSKHKNLQKATSFHWTITDENWNPSPICMAVECLEVGKDGQCLRPYTCEQGTTVCENITTKTPDTKFQFLKTGVYDIYAEIQQETPPKNGSDEKCRQVSHDLVVCEASTSNRLVYHKSLVVGKCDQGDLQIVNAKDPIIPTKGVVSSITSDHLSLAPKSRYASTFILELNGKVLEYYNYDVSHPGYPEPIENVGETEEGSDGVVGTTFDRLSPPIEKPSVPVEIEPRRIQWKVMAEMVHKKYGSLYQQVSENQGSPI